MKAESSTMVICPVCSKKYSLYKMPDHLEQADDRHLELFNDMDNQRNMAYTDAEVEWVLDKCQRAD